MKKDGKGGGATITGLIFEDRVDLENVFEGLPGYTIVQIDKDCHEIRYKDRKLAMLFKKHGFYKYLDKEGINWRRIISSQLLPDSALLVIVRETLFIIEVKFQEVPGSVDEKLQTCDFKRKQYQKLTKPLNLKVEYVYILNDWFKQPKYRDTLDYIHSVNCHYKFNELPLAWLGLPAPSE